MDGLLTWRCALGLRTRSVSGNLLKSLKRQVLGLALIAANVPPLVKTYASGLGRWMLMRVEETAY